MQKKKETNAEPHRAHTKARIIAIVALSAGARAHKHTERR